MFLVKSMQGTLVQFNRNTSTSVFDDEDTQEVSVRVCPYNADISVKFGTYTVPEATGYFNIMTDQDVKEGDQLIFKDRTYTILEVKDNWLYNKIESFTVAVR